MLVIAGQGSLWTDVACKSASCTVISIIVVIVIFIK